MSTNETIIAVPITVEQQGQTRQFLVRLIEKLDIVLGYRGNDPYVSTSQLSSIAATSNTNQLKQTILNTLLELLANDEDVALLLAEALRIVADSALESLKSSESITDNSTATQTVSAAYVQAEVQSIQNQVTTNANRMNDLLDALRATGIIAT